KPEPAPALQQFKSKNTDNISIAGVLQTFRQGIVQRESFDEEDDSLQMKSAPSLQAKSESSQAVGQVLQMFKNGIIQRESLEDEDELLQGKFTHRNSSINGESESPLQKKENRTGLPDNLKSGVETLSGFSMDDVRVHYNSPKPAQLQALAYTQGTDIHVGPSQEKHLPHEAWHVVQQMQGRVQPTMQMQGVNVNDDEGLEREADGTNEKINYSNKDERTKSHKYHSNDIVQMLSKQQRKKIKKYSIDEKFKNDHIIEGASRRQQKEVANRRGIRNSTVIRNSKKDIEDKALSVCQTGDSFQAAAEDTPKFGKQIFVRLTKVNHRTFANGQFLSPSSNPIIIVGPWTTEKVIGHHLEADQNKFPTSNDEEVFP
ncbi:DUF4157 domain-containing protein, partial [Desulfosarcina sp. OttesenSCG-928-G10]|nr:DUF4157 domain-containing protein [Desulfosarcina sp. OttesenSCG-928-G10]